MTLEKNRNKKQAQKNKTSGLGKYGKYSGMTFQMIAIILASVWLGTKLDEKFHREKPLFLIFFAILGVFTALYVVLKDFIKNSK